jgi:hypothetical protein
VLTQLANPSTALLVGSALITFAAIVILFTEHPETGFWAIGIVFLLTAATPVPLLPSGLTLGGVNWYPMDILCAALVPAAFFRLVRDPLPASLGVPFGIAAAACVLNVLRGVAEFGMQHSVNEAREWIYFFVVTGFVLSAGPGTRRVWRPWLVLTGTLVALAAVGLAQHGLHPVTTTITVGNERIDPRPINAGSALVLALVLLAWPTLATKRWTRLAGATLLVGTLVLLQHRTVWVVLLACFAVLLISAARRGSQAALNAVIAGGLAAGVAAVFVTGGLGQSSIGQSVAETGARNSTFSWRVTSWQELLHANDSVGAMLFGKPFGSGYLRELNGVMTNLPPHSFYVNSVLRIGAIGLAALVMLCVTGWRQRAAAAERLGIQPITVSCIVLAIAVFCVTYDPGTVHAAILAVVVAASRRSPARVPVRVPAPLLASAHPPLAPGLRA